VVEDPDVVQEIEALMSAYREDLASDRSTSLEAEVLGVMAELSRERHHGHLPLKDITKIFLRRHGEDYDRRITSKWIGGIIRRTLHIKTLRSHGNYVVPVAEWPKLKDLWQKYDIPVDSEAQPSHATT
jgi:hypothetical protein